MPRNRIVEFGPGLIRRSREYKLRRKEIIAEVRREYGPRLRSAGPIERLRLKLRMWREIRTHLERLVPQRGCYFALRHDRQGGGRVPE
jgi:hypothetical protein